ncbi:thioredoxin family protein [Aliiroseovarius sp.]|uniref:DUF1223 domain-containing protein n=1 Tax=Aliiroseovarius sp. TaxID=1872442 RepID=UPI0026366F97|nr:DUF1223 domain-containing protein [Aliiroseovarius sp.]
MVIELFTSQGCSSCPPADALIRELAETREDVLPLALHVDYWDYIGWADSFARPEHTKRQKAYSYAAGMRSIYTPQMVVGGIDHVIGFKPMAVAETIAAHQMASPRVILTGGLQDGVARVRAVPLTDEALPARIVAVLVRYTRREQVRITRGENAGQNLEYANIVTAMDEVGEWDGQANWQLEVEVEGEAPAALLLQTAGVGPILAALRLR